RQDAGAPRKASSHGSAGVWPARSPLALRLRPRKILPQFRQRARTVADLVLHLVTQFGKTAGVPDGDEKRIVSEATLSARSQSNSTLAHAFEDRGREFCFIRIANR